MKLDTLKAIQNWPAGQAGHHLVMYNEKVVHDAAFEKKNGYNKIETFLTTAFVDDPVQQTKLAQYTDGSVRTDRVIVVGKKFLSQLNKTQLILLERENARILAEEDAKSSGDIISAGNVAAKAKYGNFRSQLAFNKADRYRAKFENKAAKGVRGMVKNNGGHAMDYMRYGVSSNSFWKDLSDLAGMDFREVYDEMNRMSEEMNQASGDDDVIIDVDPNDIRDADDASTAAAS